MLCRLTTALFLLVLSGSAIAGPRASLEPDRFFGKEGVVLPETTREIDDRGFDCLDLRLELFLDFDTRTIQGIARHRIAASAPIDTVEFDLTDSLTVGPVWRDLSAAVVLHSGGKLRIVLDPPLSAAEETEIAIHYSGHPPRDGLLGFSFEDRDGVPAAYTVSEPTSASSWWPCKDVPNDKLTARIILDVPDSLYAGSNGLLVSDIIEEGRRRMEWSESWPIAPYLVSVACTNYDVTHDLYNGIDGRDLPLLYLAYPEDAADAKVSWGRTAAMIEAFENRFAPYPFYGEKYGMAEFSWGGAMENQTLSSIGEYAIDGTDQNDWLIAHELSHQWWGNWITPSDWDHIWLNEGFARFSEAIWYESIQGIEGYREWMRRMWRPSFPGSIVPPDFLFNSTVYLKGAWILHMLRGVLEDPTFFQALDLYMARHAYGNVDTEDFIDACEEVYGSSLRWFFDPWVYGTGRPSYISSWVLLPGGEPYEIELTIDQVQSQPPFRMPIDIAIEDEVGPYLLSVVDSLRTQTFRLPVRLPPSEVELDPNDWILRNRIGGSAVAEVPEGAPKLGVVYPSPGRPPLRVQVGSVSPDASLELFDVGGRHLQSIRIAGGGILDLEVRDRTGRELPSGIYFLRLSDKGATSTRRFWLIR